MSTRLRGAAGQSTLEWLALLLVSAAVVAVVIGSGAGDRFRAELRDAACTILRADCPAAEVTPPSATAGTEAEDSDEPDRAHRDLDGDDTPDAARVADALGELRALLDGGFTGVSADDLRAIAELLADLDDAELHAVLADLSRAELAALLAETASHHRLARWRNLPAAEQQAFFDMLAPRLDVHTIARLLAAAEPDVRTTLLARLEPEQVRRLYAAAESSDALSALLLAGQLDAAAAALGDPDEGARLWGAESELDELRWLRLDGVLFGEDGPRWQDIDQGSLGDCHLLASLGTLAVHDPAAIQDMIVDNGNGTYTVTLHDDGHPVEVTVDDRILAHPDRDGTLFSNPTGDPPVLWPLIIENAWAHHDGADLSGGITQESLAEVLGGDVDYYPAHADAYAADDGSPTAVRSHQRNEDGDGPADQLRAYDSDGGVTDVNGETWPLYAAHAYYVSDIDRATRTVTVQNPHGEHRGPIVLHYDDFERLFRGVAVGDPR